MSESLIGKPDTVDTRYFGVDLELGVTTVEVYLKNRIDNAKVFYKRYRDNPQQFKMKYPKIWNSIPNNYGTWTKWLFKYCFGG